MTINSFVPLTNSSPRSKEPRAIVKLSTATLRVKGFHAAEMATQAIMGTPVRILEKKIIGILYRPRTATLLMYQEILLLLLTAHAIINGLRQSVLSSQCINRAL